MTLPTRKPFDRRRYLQHPESRPWSRELLEGEYVFVQDENGVIWVAPNAPHQHPKVLGGARPAAAAGELILGEDGLVIEINNLSGTFRLGPETLGPVVDALRQLGFDVSEDAVKRYPIELL